MALMRRMGAGILMACIFVWSGVAAISLHDGQITAKVRSNLAPEKVVR